MSAVPTALSTARQEFITAIKRDTAPTECPRFVAVLDAMIEWSLARPTLVKFNPDASHGGMITFSRVGAKAKKVDMWSASPRKRDMPRLEVLPRAARFLTEDDRASVVQTFNAHARDELSMEEPLRINFGALKNKTARAAVLDCMDRLLAVT
jgi:hypothetical protein